MQRNLEMKEAMKNNINMQKTSTYIKNKTEAENLKNERREASNILQSQKQQE